MVHKQCMHNHSTHSSASCRPSILQQIEAIKPKPASVGENCKMVGTSPGMQLLLTLSILFISSTNQGENLHFCGNIRFIASCFACYHIEGLYIYHGHNINQARSHIDIDGIVGMVGVHSANH